jgi:ketosteroid isomerase-like protein
MNLEERLACQETAEDVRRLLAAYAGACDTHDLAALAEILHPDVELIVAGQSWHGPRDVLDFFQGRWADAPRPQRHFLTNIALHHLEPASAEATAYFLHLTADGDRPLIGWGSYRDAFSRHEGALLLRTKEITMDGTPR